tara:strand:+ start:282 stop:539 length:258 start_codon:yes stop_codon:yes gene_type:complete
MSVRAQELVEHVHIRGTKVSTSLLAPSLLHVSVVQSLGLPSTNGSTVVDNHTVYFEFDRNNDDVVWVHAYKNGPTSESEEWCTIL